MSGEKTDNGRGAKSAKVDLRLNVLAEVSPARVFDGFSGLGNMYRDAWSRAESYVGCDARDWSPDEPHPRFVADNRLVLRALDLSQFNVFDFDFDAYGSPWDQMLILLKRRTWQPGERGAVVLTDGTWKKMSFGAVSGSMAKLLQLESLDTLPRSMQAVDFIQNLLLTRWCKAASVEPRRIWRATGKGSGRCNSAKMNYTACVFEGV